VSVRLNDGWLVTPTNASLGRLDPATLSKLDDKGRHVAGDPPSKESVLHGAIYEERPRARAIVHLHSTYATAVSCLCGLDLLSCIPPLTPYFVMKIGRLPLLPYYRPGDPHLADAIRSRARHHQAVLLANHGPIVSASSLEAAVNAAEELEETAKLFLTLKALPCRPLNFEQIDELNTVFELGMQGPAETH
jgi:ribulose-5-phosphate 4-epimerase/fuculose-1-phosphate aldolase